MLDKLIESKRRHEWHTHSGVISAAAHALLIGLVVSLTAGAVEPAERVKPERERLVFTKVLIEEKPEPPPEESPKPEKKPEPPKKAPPPKSKPAPRVRPPEKPDVPPTPTKGFQALVAPLEIPDKLPPIDLSRPVTKEADFSGKGVPGGTASGVGTAAFNKELAKARNDVFLDFEVERRVRPRDGNPAPRYPLMLERARASGTVIVQFVVNARGRVEMSSVKVLDSTNRLFTRAVRDVLPRMRFHPATVGGEPVRQVVQLPFRFVPR